MPTLSDEDFIDESYVQGNEEVPRSDNDKDSNQSMSPIFKPIYLLSTWRDPRSRDGRISLIMVLPTGALDVDDAVHAEVITSKQVKVSISWPAPITDVQKLVAGVLAVEPSLDISHGTLMAQGFHDFLAQYREKELDSISSTCLIDLPFPVKPDFDEQVLMFEDSGIQLYFLQFRAPEKNYATPTKRLRVNRIGSSTQE